MLIQIKEVGREKEGDGSEHITRIDEGNRACFDKTFWSMYVKDPDTGLTICVGDYKTKEAANRVLNALKSALQ